MARTRGRATSRGSLRRHNLDERGSFHPFGESRVLPRSYGQCLVQLSPLPPGFDAWKRCVTTLPTRRTILRRTAERVLHPSSPSHFFSQRVCLFPTKEDAKGGKRARTLRAAIGKRSKLSARSRCAHGRRDDPQPDEHRRNSGTRSHRASLRLCCRIRDGPLRPTKRC